MKWLMKTNDAWSLTLIRLGLGIVILPHGLQKLFGWLGGHGIEGTLQFFASLNIPAWLGWLAIIAESFGATGLILGFLARPAALGILCVMLTALFLVHVPHGFFMNWAGTQEGEGFEFHILAIAMALVILFWGAGAASVDRMVSKEPNSS